MPIPHPCMTKYDDRQKFSANLDFTPMNTYTGSMEPLSLLTTQHHWFLESRHKINIGASGFSGCGQNQIASKRMQQPSSNISIWNALESCRSSEWIQSYPDKEHDYACMHVTANPDRGLHEERCHNACAAEPIKVWWSIIKSKDDQTSTSESNGHARQSASSLWTFRTGRSGGSGPSPFFCQTCLSKVLLISTGWPVMLHAGEAHSPYPPHCTGSLKAVCGHFTYLDPPPSK